jgi:hypothetical protein
MKALSQRQDRREGGAAPGFAGTAVNHNTCGTAQFTE